MSENQTRTIKRISKAARVASKAAWTAEPDSISGSTAEPEAGSGRSTGRTAEPIRINLDPYVLPSAQMLGGFLLRLIL